MQLHAALVALVNGKLQGVVARVASGTAGEIGCPGFYVAGIDGVGANAGMQQNGIDVDSLQQVQDVDKFLLLGGGVLSVEGAARGPVEIAKNGEPYGTNLVFGL